MTDYLNHIIAKTFRLEPVIEPRAPSLFEPLAETHTLSFSAPEESKGSVQRQSLPLTAKESIERKRELASRPPESVSNEEAGKSKPAIAERDGPGFDTFAGANRIRGVATETITQMNEERVQEDNPISVMASPADKIAVVTSMKNGSRSLAKQALFLTKTNVADAHSSGDHDQKPKTALLREQIAPEIEIGSVNREHSISSDPAESAPTIRITIGRVDVRAMMSSPQTTRPTTKKTGPMLSLEDYLKQRERGKG